MEDGGLSAYSCRGVLNPLPPTAWRQRLLTWWCSQNGGLQKKDLVSAAMYHLLAETGAPEQYPAVKGSLELCLGVDLRSHGSKDGEVVSPE